MDFCLLGPLLVRSGGAVVPVRRGKQRAVLAALLLSGGQVVSLDELAEILWEAEPPPSARVTIQNYVMRLRQALGDTGGSRISTQPHGYLIRVDPAELDVARFEALLGAAREAARDSSWDTAAAQSREALALWRGEPLSDVGSEVLAAREVPRLAELRLQALEVRIDADLHLGRQAEVLAESRQLVSGHPLREHLHGLLMLALYRDGRQAEALAAYRDARRVLVEELGTEPGTGLRELHQRMLAGDPALVVPAAAPPAAGPAVPRELPAGVAHFTGRTRELAALSGLLGAPGAQAPGTVVISAIGGTAGVGKTALAVHWAHQAAGRFPDGQLYVNLRSYDPARPVTPADALAGFLRSLGVAGQDIPVEEADRAARYRSLLAGRRMLVVLDNAGSAEQVRPLLPGDPACAVVVTSRDSLTGLVARDGAQRLDLDLLPPEDAVGLLRALIGARVDADPAAAALLASRCCRLPLALRVAAELAAARPAAPLAELAGELADRQRRLDLLDADGDPRSAVRAVLSWSCRHLDTAAARALRLIGLHPGPDLDLYAAAALIGTTPAGAGQLLDQLAHAHLIQPARPGRCGMHDLLRAYACELAAQDGKQEQRAALTRLFDYYLAAAGASMDALAPAERHLRPLIPPSATPLPPLRTPDAASAWLDAERPVLVAVAAGMATGGWPEDAIRLSTILFRYYRDIGGHYDDALAVHTHALHAAERSGDRAAQADALRNRGMVDYRLGRYQQAADQIRQALEICRDLGDRSGQARAHSNLGVVLWGWARYQPSAEHFRQALVLHRELGDQFGQANALDSLGTALGRAGHYPQAAEHHRQALEICRELGNRRGEARALANLGAVLSWQGRCQEAVGHLQSALAVFRQFGDRLGEADALKDLAAALRCQGRYDEAVCHHKQALAMFRELGNRSGETEALNGLGEAFLASGQPGDALAQHTSALALASQIGDAYEQARAHHGLARAHQAAGDPGQARHHWQQALALFTTLGTPEADQVRAELIAAGEDTYPEHR
jgi:DNA-binding SARP family transcriptional activator/tetratricopeptide (TPR) repeat protein